MQVKVRLSKEEEKWKAEDVSDITTYWLSWKDNEWQSLSLTTIEKYAAWKNLSQTLQNLRKMVSKKQKKWLLHMVVFQESYNKLYPNKHFLIDENIAESFFF